MTIASIGVTAFAIPYKRPLALATGTVAEHRAVLVTVSDGNGHSGCGEIAPGPGTCATEIAALAVRARRKMAALHGLPVDDTDDVRRLRQQLEPALRPACEAALLDLAAQRAGLPLCQLLGASRAAPAALSVNAMIDRAAPEVSLAAARRAIQSGYTTLKIKVDRDGLDGCIELLGLLRREYGSAVAIRLDCNGSWSLQAATDAMRALEPYDLEYIEQPTRSLTELAQLRSLTSIAVAADESAADLAAVRTALDIGAADVLILKPARMGLIDAIEAATLARSAGVGVVVTSNLDTSVGTAAALHLARAIASDSSRYAHGLATVALLGGDLCGGDDSLIAHNGSLTVPNATGCGIRVDSNQLARWSQ